MVVFTGKTVETAIELGLNQLQLERTEAQIRVLAREKKGFFGLGRKPAQVEIEPLANALATDQQADTITVEKTKSSTTPVAPTSAPATTSDTKTDKESFETFVAKEFKEEPQYNLEEAGQAVCDYVSKIIYDMDLEATISMSLNRRHINLQIDTPEPGRVIGYHGKVLKALQLLAQNFLHDRYSRHYSVSINVHDYLEHRTETLIEFSRKIATHVLESQREYLMDPMSNSERKIVHKTIAKIPGVDSYSEGNDPNRYVVVTLSKS